MTEEERELWVNDYHYALLTWSADWDAARRYADDKHAERRGAAADGAEYAMEDR